MATRRRPQRVVSRQDEPEVGGRSEQASQRGRRVCREGVKSQTSQRKTKEALVEEAHGKSFRRSMLIRTETWPAVEAWQTSNAVGDCAQMRELQATALAVASAGSGACAYACAPATAPGSPRVSTDHPTHHSHSHSQNSGRTAHRRRLEVCFLQCSSSCFMLASPSSPSPSPSTSTTNHPSSAPHLGILSWSDRPLRLLASFLLVYARRSTQRQRTALRRSKHDGQNQTSDLPDDVSFACGSTLIHTLHSRVWIIGPV